MINKLWDKIIEQQNTKCNKKAKYIKIKMRNFTEKSTQSFGRLLISE